MMSSHGLMLNYKAKAKRSCAWKKTLKQYRRVVKAQNKRENIMIGDSGRHKKIEGSRLSRRDGAKLQNTRIHTETHATH
jgi:hypothetical protein